MKPGIYEITDPCGVVTTMNGYVYAMNWGHQFEVVKVTPTKVITVEIGDRFDGMGHSFKKETLQDACQPVTGQLEAKF